MKFNATVAVVGKIIAYETCCIPKNIDQDSPLMLMYDYAVVT